MLITLHALLIPMTFALGAAVGSFSNVCIYRIPWEKSLVWPASTCPRCLSPIAARDNWPILGWLLLGGRCRSCKEPISARYPSIEALVGLLFVAAYLADVAYVGDRLMMGDVLVQSMLRAGYHQLLLAFLVVATFIDYDHMIIPDEVTITGMVVGLGFAALVPGVRPEPGTAATAIASLKVGGIGLLAGGLLVAVVRFLGTLAFRREAMGFGDVTLLAMIGAFLGWQAAVLTFFLAPFFGLAHAGWKVVNLAWKLISGRPRTGSDHELPFGPYLSMAATGLVLGWPWIWPGWADPLFRQLSVVFWFMVGLER
ncbi:MAG: prepilin peptidase [Isosphaeraceae bacterium]